MLDVITAPGLTHNLNIDTKGKDTQTIFTEIIAQLKSLSAERPNLLVIDNANTTLQRYFEYLPKPPYWHTLATSREKIERFYVKDLDFLSEADAVLLFRQHCQRISDEAQIRSLLKTIDYHTLTIEILAKTAQRHDTPLTILQEAIERDLKAEVYIPHKGDKIGKVTSYLLSIFDLAPLSAEEQRLLQHFTAMPTVFIPYEGIKYLIPEQEKSIAATLQDLSDKGWLMYSSDHEAYKIHRIIQEVVKRKLPPNIGELSELILRVGDLFNIDQNKDNPVDKFPFIPFGEAVLALFPDATEPEMSVLQNNLATVFKALGDYSSAKDLLEKSMRSDEANFGEKHPNTAVRYSNLALVLRDLGDYKGAKNLLEKAIISDEENNGENHPSTMISYSNLANILYTIGDYTSAKVLLEKVMLSNKANFGENHPMTTVSYSNLAVVLQALGDYPSAKYLFEKALYYDETNFVENHPITATRYNNLATSLIYSRDYTVAKVFLEKAMQVTEINFGKKHPTTATIYFNLAALCVELEDYKNAFLYIQKTCAIYMQYLDKDHPNTKNAYEWSNHITNKMLENGWTEEQIAALISE